MSNKDLNGFQSLFSIPWPDAQTRRLRVHEKKTIRGHAKENDVFVQERLVIESVNNFVVFTEYVLNDNPEILIGAFQEISILYRALEEMERDGVDPQAVALVQNYIDIIERELEAAWNTGSDLGEFLKAFYNDPDFQARSLAFLKHPLLKPPYSPNAFKVIPYYQQ